MSATITEIRKPIEDLTLPQINTEISQRYNEAHGIIKKADANAEEMAKAQALLEEIDQFEVVRQRKETAEQTRTRVLDGIKRYERPAGLHTHADVVDRETREGGGRHQRMSPGEQFVELAEFKRLLQSGTLNSGTTRVPEFAFQLKDWNVMEHKTLVQGADSASGGAFVINDRQPGLVDIRQRQLTVLDLITRLRTSSDAIDFVREDTFTNNAATVAEATATTGTSGTKPESALAYSLQSSPVQTVAHWIPVTSRMLADVPAIRGLIDARLLLGLDLQLETQVISGDGTGSNLTGILTNTGVQTQALGTDSVIDALFKAMVKVQVTGLALPNAHVMHPLDFQDVRLARENAATGALGGYLLGPPTQVGATTLWGLPVVLSLGMTNGTAVTADWSALTMALFGREQSVIRVGYINDQFIRNMLTILAELRAAFTMFRPSGVCKVTGV